MVKEKNKVMTASEAIQSFVNHGDNLIIGNYTVGTCSELVFEIARQQKKELNLHSQSGIFDVEILIGSGCISKFVSTYIFRAGGREGGSAVERALKAKTLLMEDYSNFQYNARLMAGMHGFSFMQVLESGLKSDLFHKRSFMKDQKYKVIICPYTGKEILTVPALNPDVCVIHVQRADKFGNSQYWGPMGSVTAAALASKKIIVSCEEIVETDVIRSSPHLTIIPSYRVDAVVESPWGAHPSEVLGYYNIDKIAYINFILSDMSKEGLNTWLDKWVFGCKNRKDYIKKYVQEYGQKPLNDIRAKPYYSAPANYGSAFSSCWDEKGRERFMGVTLDELNNLIEERGLLHG